MTDKSPLAMKTDALLRLYAEGMRDFSSVNLVAADLRNVKLKGIKLCEADLGEAQLQGADLSEADLCDANFESADLSGTQFQRANLSGANLSHANVRDANFSQARLVAANFFGSVGEFISHEAIFQQTINAAGNIIRGSHLPQKR